MPHWRKISMLRVLIARPLGKSEVDGCRSTSRQSMPKCRRPIAVERPTGPPPTTRTGTSTSSLPVTSRSRASRGCDAVEERPPELERARDGALHVRLERRRRRQTDHDVVTDGAVLAVRLLVDVPEGHLPRRAAVVPLEGAREGTERARHLPFGGEVGGCGAFNEGMLAGRPLEPVDEGDRRRERDAVHHGVGRNAHPFTEADEELRVRYVAAGDAAGLLLVEALRQLDPLVDVGARGVQRAHGARELAHLEEELHGEGAEGRARELA